jgi:hypothetical protein
MNNVKKCSRCGEILPIEQFSTKANRCRDCVRIYSAEWCKKNPDKSKEKSAKFRQNHPGYDSGWRKNNLEKDRLRRNKYQRERILNDLNFKMRKGIRSAVCNALRGNIKYIHAIDLLGCSLEDLRRHIERQFQPGMTWENWGRYGWHIDHIIPVSYFDMADPEQQKQAWHYTNLQPLWAEDNLKKNNKILERQLILM